MHFMTNAISKIIGPGLIVMVDGVFRPAGIADVERRYGSLDIRDWFELGDEQIDPETIEMTSAAYLGARKFLEWRGWDIVGKNSMLRNLVPREYEKSRAANINSVMSGIVHQAAELGARTGARYFGVITDTFSPQKALDLTHPPGSFFGASAPESEDDSPLYRGRKKEMLKEPESRLSDVTAKRIYAPHEGVEVELHPTASFYRER